MRAKLLFLGGVGLTALYFLFSCVDCIATGSQEISSGLQTRTANAIAGAGIRGVSTKADGRDIILTGQAPTEAVKLKAAELALAISGVRSVDNQLTVAGK